MELIIDANIVIAALISFEGKTRSLIFNDSLSLFAPEYLMDEIQKYREYISKKARLEGEEFDLALDLISSRIKFIPFDEFKKFLTKAREISPDEYDTEYFALALALNFPIWSNDKLLKVQNIVKIYSTTELLENSTF